MYAVSNASGMSQSTAKLVCDFRETHLQAVSCVSCCFRICDVIYKDRFYNVDLRDQTFCLMLTINCFSITLCCVSFI